MLTFALFAVLAAAGHSQGLADLAVNPDDIMLRRPSNAAAEKAAAERAAAEKAAAEKAAAEKAAAERAAAEKAAAEKAAAERAAAEKAAAEKAAAEKAAAEKAAAEKAAAEKAAAEKAAAEKAAKKAKAKQRSGRPAVITAERTDYDRKEGVILFDRNVHVDDEQYQMHADRLFVFLDGTNDLKRLVALGNVAITNEEKTAECAKAVYTRALQRIVMYGDGPGKPARLRDAGGKKGEVSEVRGGKITYGIDSGLATVEQVEVELPAMKGAGPKDLFGIKGREKAEDKK